MYYDEKHKIINFDNDKFWNWILKQKNNNNIIIISEYKCPIKCKTIKIKKISHLSGYKLKQEKLFIIANDNFKI
jgi:hypothetical protein